MSIDDMTGIQPLVRTSLVPSSRLAKLAHKGAMQIKTTIMKMFSQDSASWALRKTLPKKDKTPKVVKSPEKQILKKNLEKNNT